MELPWDYNDHSGFPVARTDKGTYYLSDDSSADDAEGLFYYYFSKNPKATPLYGDDWETWTYDQLVKWSEQDAKDAAQEHYNNLTN